MIFQVRTNNFITNSEDFTEDIRSSVEPAIVARHGDRLRRIEVYIEDVNSHKGGDNDIRCGIEVHLAGLPAFTADHRAGAIDDAVDGAVEAVLKLLDRRLGKIEDRAGHTSAAGDQGY